MSPRFFQILIVEDEAAIADNLLYALKTEGFGVEWLSLGGEADARIRNAAVDLVILDVGLPDMSGFEVCKRIRRHSEVPILFLTAPRKSIASWGSRSAAMITWQSPSVRARSWRASRRYSNARRIRLRTLRRSRQH